MELKSMRKTFRAVSGRLSRLGVLAAFAVLAFSGPKDAKRQSLSDARQQIWAIRFAQFVKEPPEWTAVERHATQALAFSPDDKRLAVTLTHHQRVSERNALFNTHLLVIEVNSPDTSVRQFDLTQTCGVDLTWNERGDAILVCGVILRIADGTTCTVNSPRPGYPTLSREYGPHRAFWLDSDHVVRRDGEIVDMACNQVGTWRVQPTWQIRAVAVSKGWVLLWHSEGPREKTVCQYSIVDLTSHLALSGWPTRKVPFPCGAGGIAVGAEAFCFSLHSQNVFDNGKLHCRAINGGMEIPVPKQVRDYGLRLAADSSSRIVVEKWELDHDPWWALLWTWWAPDPGTPALPRRRVAFDLRSGSLISSWKPWIQSYTSAHVEDWPSPCALSAGGEFLSESGDGGLELYRLAP